MTLNEKLISVIQAHKPEHKEYTDNGAIVLLSKGPRPDIAFLCGNETDLVASLAKAMMETDSLRDAVYSAVAVSLKHKPNPRFFMALEAFLKGGNY